jgi:hypothetical protein
VAKAEQLEGKENPRFVVTNLGGEPWPAQRLYEVLYCQRGELENRIKEQLTLFAARVSAATLAANQVRLYLLALAYVLVHGLRRLGLQGTAWGAGDNDPAAAVEDRRAHPHHGAKGVDLAGVELSAPNYFCARLGAVAELSGSLFASPSKQAARAKNGFFRVRRENCCQKPALSAPAEAMAPLLDADSPGCSRARPCSSARTCPSPVFARFPTLCERSALADLVAFMQSVYEIVDPPPIMH